jgi:hypothetical protein
MAKNREHVMPRKRDGGEAASYMSGLILGFVISAPLAAWLSPRSGADLRKTITQRGVIIRRTLQKPVEQVQGRLEQLRGDSVEDALNEGRAIAARQQIQTES